MKALLGLVMAAALIAPATQAAQTEGPGVTGAGSIILAEGGCGRDYHRDFRGYCVPNWREWEGRACPPGWHLGPEGRRCWPN
jgi:hypothetical protein